MPYQSRLRPLYSLIALFILWISGSFPLFSADLHNFAQQQQEEELAKQVAISYFQDQFEMDDIPQLILTIVHKLEGNYAVITVGGLFDNGIRAFHNSCLIKNESGLWEVSGLYGSFPFPERSKKKREERLNPAYGEAQYFDNVAETLSSFLLEMDYYRDRFFHLSKDYFRTVYPYTSCAPILH